MIKRVAVTGIGMIDACGNNTTMCFDNVLSNEDFAKPVSDFFTAVDHVQAVIVETNGRGHFHNLCGVMYLVELFLGHVVDVAYDVAITTAVDVGFKKGPVVD